MGIETSRTLVTGGAGFIGSELTRQLTEGLSFVTVVDSLVNGRRENLFGVLSERARLEVEDIRNTPRMGELMQVVDIASHHARCGVRESIHSSHEQHTVD